MPKPQYSNRSAVQRHLTQDQVLCLLAASPDTGEICAQRDPILPGWLLVECYDLGLVMPGEEPGTWKLSPDGWDARIALLSD
ncbi:hypothetical protein ABNQ39_11525 [Azospirillum sp. A26]|uniref:hypothetical protein n=1 Tax=Azospirillum sp. A26 TaxID=3160607 RepID=UPI00366F4682